MDNNQTNTGFLSKIKNAFSSLTNYIKKNFENLKQKFSKSNQSNEVHKFIIEPSLVLPKDDNILLQVINDYISVIRWHYYNLGYFDGEIPVRSQNHKSIIKRHVSRIVEHVNSVINERIGFLTEFKEAKETIKEDREKALPEWKGKLNKIMDFYGKSYREFSLITAWMCFIFGLVLFLADFPLSIKLVGYFDVGVKNNDTIKTVFGGDTAKDWDWDIILFSLGIMFCTIYTKILYDEYIATKTGDWFNYGDSDEPESKKKNSNKKIEIGIKTTVKLLILVLFIWLLVYLGIFRTLHSDIDYQGIQEKLKEVTGSNVNPIYSNEEIFNIMIWCFVLITLIIPIISGICLSICFSIWHNRKLKKVSEKKVAKLQGEIDNIIIKIAEINATIQKLNIAKDEWTKETKKTNIEAELIGFYNSGFLHSYRTKYGNDLYRQIEEIRNEITINKLFNYEDEK